MLSLITFDSPHECYLGYYVACFDVDFGIRSLVMRETQSNKIGSLRVSGVEQLVM